MYSETKGVLFTIHEAQFPTISYPKNVLLLMSIANL
jgi:hypothetical protein